MEGKLYGNLVKTEGEGSYNSVRYGHEDRRRVTLDCSFKEYELIIGGLFALQALHIQKKSLDKFWDGDEEVTYALSQIKRENLAIEPGSDEVLYEYR